jgi:NADH-quinone oxidoreductase subunit I
MIVKRAKLTFWERLYLPAIAGGFKITARHLLNSLLRGHNTARELGQGYYPEVPWTVGPGYRGAPYLVRDQEGKTKCVSCQLCEFICPPKAIQITPPGPDGPPADRSNAEKMPREFKIDMLRCIFCGFCQEVCPEEAIFLQKDYSLTGHTRAEMIYGMEKLLALGGEHAGVQKWRLKQEEARQQDTLPVNTER